MTVKKWDEERFGPLTLEKLRELFPVDKHIVRPGKYEREFGIDGKPLGRIGWHAAGRIYVLTGRCAMTFEETTFLISANESLDFPRGDFEFKIFTDTVDYIGVYRLPDEMVQNTVK